MNPKKNYFVILLFILCTEFSFSQKTHSISANIILNPCGIVVDDSGHHIDDPENVRPFVIYPNPTSNFVIIESVHPEAEVLLLDTTGRLIFRGNFNDGRMELDMQGLASGIYRINVRNEFDNRLINILVNN